MIFVTVGMQLPFTRLVRFVDEIAPTIDEEIVAQVGDCDHSAKSITCHRFLDAADFKQHVSKASLIIGHAGVGTILTAQRAEKPLIIIPRDARLGEHRSNHQFDTAAQMLIRPGIYVARDLAQLKSLILRRTNLTPLADAGNGLAALTRTIHASLADALHLTAAGSVPQPVVEA